MTRLFSKRSVHAVVTESKIESRRLFLCTESPEKLHFDTDCTGTRKAAIDEKTDVSLLPLSIYALRWHIETAFYEQKRFWSFSSYMLRSRDGIECLLNLLTILYSMMTLLPFLDSDFSFLSGESSQQSRFLLSRCLHQELFFATFGYRPKITKNIFPRNSSCSHRSVSA